MSPRPRWALTPPFHPCLIPCGPSAVCFLLCRCRITPPGRYPAPCPRSPDFPLVSCETSDHPPDSHAHAYYTRTPKTLGEWHRPGLCTHPAPDAISPAQPPRPPGRRSSPVTRPFPWSPTHPKSSTPCKGAQGVPRTDFSSRATRPFPLTPAADPYTGRGASW